MEGVMYSWLGAAALAPFVTILSAWTLVVFCSYKSRWRLADLFFFAMTAHEIVFSLFAFGFSVLNIIRPILNVPCGFIVWGLAGTRTFHLSLVTSLLLDKALSSKWPYKYRDSVRGSQVRYHVVVLGIIAIFVGVTAVFARIPSSMKLGVCSIHPLAWDAKFSIFLASVYSMLLLTGLACFLMFMTEDNNNNNTLKKTATAASSPVSEKPSPAPTLDSSGRSTMSSNSSKVYNNEWGELSDVKWQTIASVCCVSYVANHGPYLVMTIAGIIVPSYWSSWQDNITIWLSLSQGILVPLILLVSDLPHRSAVKNMLRQPGRIYRHLSDHSGFHMQVADSKCQKSGLSSTILMMYPGSTCVPLHHNPFQVPHRLRWTPQTLPSLQSLTLEKHSLSPRHTPSENDSICKSSSSRCTSPVPPTYRDILYSTYNSSCHSLLSRSCSSKVSNSSQEPRRQQETVIEEEDTISITTDALDDFEFHGAGDSSPKTTDPHIKAMFDVFNSTKLGERFNNVNETDSSKNDTNSSSDDSNSLRNYREQTKICNDRISCIFRPPSRSSRQDIFMLGKGVFNFKPPPSERDSINSIDSLEIPECNHSDKREESNLKINPCYINFRRMSAANERQKSVSSDEEKRSSVASSFSDQNIIFSEYL